MIMQYRDNMSYEQIAVELGVSTREQLGRLPGPWWHVWRVAETWNSMAQLDAWLARVFWNRSTR